MKKNIFSVIIAALTVINVVLTAIMFFVMLPTFQKTNNLITQVASVLNLELEDGDSEGAEDYSLGDLEAVPVAFEEQQTLNLATGDDGKLHYAMLDGYTLSLNKKSKDYKKLSDTVKNNETKFTDIIRSVIQSHTVDDISEEVVKQESLEKIQELLDSQIVVEVSLTNLMYN
jgi:flagellar FliL protein